MALSESVVLNISEAQRQIDQLETQLAELSQPVPIDVDIDEGAKLAQLRQELGLSDDAVERLNSELNQTDDALRAVGREADRAGDEMESVGRRGVSAFSGLGKQIVGFVGALGAIQGARAFVNFAQDSIEAASDLEESTSKAQVVFGEFFADIEAFSQTAPQALGLANAQALEFAGTFGNLFVALGLSQQAAADLAPQIVQLGADLASFNNIEVTDALDKLRAGLVGEAEPLRALGVNLTAAATAAKAVELGLAESTNQVSEAAKVQARYALILEQTTTAQGDFARTADGIANRQRTLAGEFENLRASVGEALLPAFESIIEIAPSVIDVLEQGLVPALASVGSALGEVDTSGFVRTLSGLPSAVGSSFNAIEEGGSALINVLGGIASVARLDLVSAFEEFDAAAENISDLQIGQTINSSIQNLLTTIQGGVDPLRAFESVLVDLGDANLPADKLGALATQLAAIAGIGADDAASLFGLARQVDAVGAAAGFSEAEIDALRNALLALARDGLDPADAKFRDIRQSVEEPDFEGAAAGVRQMGDALQELEPLDTSQFEENIARLDELFRGLPSGLDDAAEALRDKEGEIITDIDRFLGNLQTEVAESVEFSRLIGILEGRGQNALAEFYRQEGEEAIGALREAVANPQEAAAINDLLASQAEQNAQAYRQAFITALSEQDYTFEARVNLIISELGLSGQVRDAGEVLVDGQLPKSSQQQGGVTNNFYTEPQPTVDTNRITQSISGTNSIRAN